MSTSLGSLFRSLPAASLFQLGRLVDEHQVIIRPASPFLQPPAEVKEEQQLPRPRIHARQKLRTRPLLKRNETRNCSILECHQLLFSFLRLALEIGLAIFADVPTYTEKYTVVIRNASQPASHCRNVRSICLSVCQVCQFEVGKPYREDDS